MTGAEKGMAMDNGEQRIRQVLADYARLSVDVQSLGVDDDLFGLGMTSHACVNVMLGLEDSFGFEFPERLLTKTTFTSVASMAQAVRQEAPGEPAGGKTDPTADPTREPAYAGEDTSSPAA